MTTNQPFKCDACEYGFHGECETPIKVEDITNHDGAEACCCAALGLYFDEEGEEFYPDGTLYIPRGEMQR